MAGRITVLTLGVAAALVVLSVRIPWANTAGTQAPDAVASTADCRDASIVARLREIPEASGLAVSRTSPDLLWSLNDSSDTVVYAIARDGAIKGRVRLTGAAVTDWEAVTTAPCPQGSCLYVGDIGDNQASRERITIYRAPEPAPGDTASANAERFDAMYPDGAQDAEALFATRDGTLFVVTKGDKSPVHIYRVPAPTGSAPVTLLRVATLTGNRTSKSARVTDAAVSPGGEWVVLRTNDKLFFYRASELTAGQAGHPREFDLRALAEPQGEGIAWTRDNTLYLVGEGGDGGTLARVSCNLPSPDDGFPVR